MAIGKKRLAQLALLVLVVFAAIWVGARFLPDAWDVQRSENIEASAETIYARLVELKRWEEWKPWGKQKDASFELLFEGPVSGEGATLKWRNRLSGQGLLKITEVQANKGVWYDMTMGRAGRVKGSFVLTPFTGGTQLTWTQTGEASENPLTRYFGLAAERALGPQMEAALSRLKTLSEGL